MTHYVSDDLPNFITIAPYLGKPGTWDLLAYGAMCVFSTSGPNLSKSSFCDIHVKEPLY